MKHAIAAIIGIAIGISYLWTHNPMHWIVGTLLTWMAILTHNKN